MGPSYNFAEPWARQPCDSDLSWALFQAFLALPLPRRLRDVLPRARGLGLDWAGLEIMALTDLWEGRTRAWDNHLDQIRTQTVEQVTAEDARARAERQARAAKKLTRLAELELDSLLVEAERLRASGGLLGLVPVKDLARLIGIGVKTERLALGDVTEKIETGPDLSKLSLEELRAIREIQERIGS